jgi:hypothetical protein
MSDPVIWSELFDNIGTKMLDLKMWTDVSQVLANLATVAGIITIVFAYRSYRHEAAQQRDDAERQRREAETLTYLSLNTTYIDWLKLCFENPQLEVPDFAEIGTVDQTYDPSLMQDPDWKKEQLAFVILTNMFEQAFFLYHDKESKFKKAQWDGWSEYIKSYVKKPTYDRYWKTGGGTFFDARFVKYMHDRFPQLKHHPVVKDGNPSNTYLQIGQESLSSQQS